MDLRGLLPLGMLLRFCDPRRNQVAPLSSAFLDSLNDEWVPSYSKIIRLSGMLEKPLLFPLPIALFEGGAFIVRLLAFGQGDL